MPLGTMIFLLLFIVTALVAAVLYLQLRKFRSSHGSVDEEMKKMQSNQAQVIHTTKLASLGQMVAGVAHEINTPLGFVKSNAEVISDLLSEYNSLVTRTLQGVDFMLGVDPANLEAAKKALAKVRMELYQSQALKDAKDLLTDSQDGLKQLSSLVTNLKGFARVDRDGLDLMDVNEGVESALTIAAHQMRDRVRVVKKLNQVPKVRCMPSQINQVFLNLITNAAQAIDGNGTLTIGTRHNDGSVEISFEDTGSGIPADVLPKIFDPFFTTKPVGEGTGLGLSIVHKIVQSHGGTIKVRTTPKIGTTFTVMLPVDAPGKATAGGKPSGKPH